jgi:hypothetical protein
MYHKNLLTSLDPGGASPGRPARRATAAAPVIAAARTPEETAVAATPAKT